MATKHEYLTREGLAKLEAELKYLKEVRRPEVAARIQQAKDLGGTVNNADYESAKNDQAFVEGRILELETLLKNATLIEEKPASNTVQLGSEVVLADDQGEKSRYILVGTVEANPKEGKISIESPVGKALLGKKKGQTVEVRAPSGARKLKIVEIH
jgi:transcription elongation factor GreA